MVGCIVEADMVTRDEQMARVVRRAPFAKRPPKVRQTPAEACLGASEITLGPEKIGELFSGVRSTLEGKVKEQRLGLARWKLYPALAVVNLGRPEQSKVELPHFTFFSRCFRAANVEWIH